MWWSWMSNGLMYDICLFLSKDFIYSKNHAIFASSILSLKRYMGNDEITNIQTFINLNIYIMANKLFKSFFAVAMVLGSALGFVACEDQVEDVVGDPTVEVSATTLNFTNEEGSQTVEVTSNASWKVENDADWVTVTPENGAKNGTITVAVSMNDSGEVDRKSVV